MAINNITKVLHIKKSIAVKINPAFYQLLNESSKGWFYERFINLVSYYKQGQHIIDFIDNNSDIYESCIKTIHVYGVTELPAEDFNGFVEKSVLNDQFINLWCDEYYIKDSLHYRNNHFVHPLTIYGIKNDQICCEFFAIDRGMILIEIPFDDLRQAFYSIEQYYAHGASYDILKASISTYKVKERERDQFDLSIFNQELCNYWHGKHCSFTKHEGNVEGINLTYGIAYYNDLLELIKNPQRYSSFPYKCLFDLHLHKLFLVERLKYVREMFGFDENFDTLILRIEEVAKLYERMNMINMKYNMRDKIPPYILSQNLEFKEKLASLLIRAFEIETSTVPQIIAYLNQIINNQYDNNIDDFLIEHSDNGMILRPCFDEYVQQFSIRITSVINHELPVQIQLSNGYVYFPDILSGICTYSFRPVKLTWIKVSNCSALSLFHVGKLSNKTASALNRFSLTQWRPLNHIDNWEIYNNVAKFNICGVDPYIVHEGINIDAKKCAYISITYATDDMSNKAQLYFMTDESPIYSKDKSLTFDISNSNKEYTYKLDMSDNQAWDNIVTLLRFDPAHYPAQYKNEHIPSRCVINNISVSSNPFAYSSDSDYADGQRINQWEYCYYENGEEKYLEYDKNENIWKADNGSCIGVDFQNATQEITVSRNWRCPSVGRYQIILSGECDMEDSIIVAIDNNKIYGNADNHIIRYMDNVELKNGSTLRFASKNGCLKDLSIKIQKILLD